MTYKNKTNKVYVIAEIGVNHNGSLPIAKKLIYAAKKSGADAVKFQNFTADNLVTKSAKKAPYQIRNTKKKNSQFEMLKKLELSISDYYKLKKYAKKLNINYLSSVFDEKSVFFLLEKLKLKEIKIPSGEITNFLMLKKLDLLKSKIYLSTGMSNVDEIINAINVIAKSKVFKKKKNNITIVNKNKFNTVKKKLVVMHCVTDYPVSDKYANLECINTLQNLLKLNIGYSDHTSGTLAPVIAASKGARVIEKHFTLDKSMDGPDHIASSNPKEFKEMVDKIRKFETMNGVGKKQVFHCEIKNIKIARKSIVAKADIKKGEKFTLKNLTTKRPGNGVCASKFKFYINLKSKKNYRKNELI